jgi:hypothetical protein
MGRGEVHTGFWWGRLEYHIKMGFKVIGSQGTNINDLTGDGDSRLFLTWQ